jgi:GTPase SAR1 family protein
MKIIMLTGESNRGKTASLHFVLEILVAYGASITFFEHVESVEERDFSSVLKYRRKTIKIYTVGDIECKDKIREVLFDKKYDFLICACNNDLKRFFKQATYRIEKTVAETNACRLAANWYDASRIIELLDKSIKQRRKV